MPALTTATPRVLSDATEVLANPDRYRERPTLVHLAREVIRTQTTSPLRLVERGA
jgi:hypothetical protein